MPKIIIDNIPIEVPEETTVLEAARSIGITIPHFCWHPALGKVGACRVCAVKMLEGPVKGLQMSCMLPVQDGMVVSTTDEEALAMRRAVIEWLMINHPHDCPVCDEGGECQLQDYTIAGGHGIRRYKGLKRTHRNQLLGPFIEHEMNRCIQCYRCVRFYQEYAGGSDFGVMGRSAMVYFGRQQDGQLESPFSGNLVDICPTGVFTDKTARFRARYWDYDMAPSICPHCSLGCNIVPMARYRELLKVTARQNDRVNGWFICDRGRFSNADVNAENRPRQACVDGTVISMEGALDIVSERVKEFIKLYGPEALAIVGSPRMSLEGNLMATRLRDTLGAGALCFFDTELLAARTAAAVSLLHSGNTASQEDVRNSDLVAIIGCDLLNEAPMMALAVRQAWRFGGKVYLVGGERSSDTALKRMCDFEEISSLADIQFSEAKCPVIICGTRNSELENLLFTPFDGVKLAFILDGPNTFGCSRLAAKYNAAPCSETLASGKIKGIISFEADIQASSIDGIELLIAADWRTTDLIQRADIVLPVTSWIEMGGTFVNYEGRAQSFKKVMNPGLPLKGPDPCRHPPREHGTVAPGGDLLSSEEIIAELIKRCAGEHSINPITEEIGSFCITEGLDMSSCEK